MLLRRAGLRAVLGFALVSVAAVVMFVYGDYSRHGNAARLIEEAVYSRIGGKAKDFCYLLTTFTWSGMGILASLMGDVLKSDRAPWRKAGIIAMCGAGALVSGWVLSFWVPPIRFVYTVSFVFETLGLSTLLLAALYVLTDILGARRGTWVLILFGQCSMAAWVDPLWAVFYGGLGDYAVLLQFVDRRRELLCPRHPQIDWHGCVPAHICRGCACGLAGVAALAVAPSAQL